MVSQVLVAGLPSSGKSSAIGWLVVEAERAGVRVARARVQCFDEAGAAPPDEAGRPSRSWVSGGQCPDHFLVEHDAEILAWAEQQRASLLVLETAGLCGRCSPFPRTGVAVCVVDLTMGRSAVQKVGPMLSTADVCVLTRADRVSWTELVMQRSAVLEVTPGCAVVVLNGLTGEGRTELWAAVARQLESGAGGVRDGSGLRSPAPQFYCSFCLGQSRVGIFQL